MQLDVAARESALLQIPLVVFLGFVKGACRLDGRDDGSPVATAGIASGARGSGRRLLGRGGVEDDRAILGADVRPLTVQGRRIVVVPEDLQELIVGNARWVERDLDNLGVSRA